MDIGINTGAFPEVFLSLFIFGIFYNALVNWVETKGYDEGYMSLIVALGVGITLAGVAILSIQAALLSLAAFICTGSPMIAGSISRYMQRREAHLKALRENVNNDKSPDVAE